MKCKTVKELLSKSKFRLVYKLQQVLFSKVDIDSWCLNSKGLARHKYFSFEQFLWSQVDEYIVYNNCKVNSNSKATRIILASKWCSHNSITSGSSTLIRQKSQLQRHISCLLLEPWRNWMWHHAIRLSNLYLKNARKARCHFDMILNGHERNRINTMIKNWIS